MDELSFYTLAGERLDLGREPASVAEARQLIAHILQVGYFRQIVLLLPDGSALDDTAELPQGCSLQVQKIPPKAGTWPCIMWDAENLDEEALREALLEAYPPPVGEVDLSAWVGSRPNWGEDLSEEEKWARFTSEQMQKATVHTVGTWADYWRFAEMADTYGDTWLVEAPFRSRQKTVDLVVSTVKRWRGLLRELDATFAALKERTKEMNLTQTWEIAAAELLKYSRCFATKTSFKYSWERWYLQFACVLEWFADFAHLEVHPRSFSEGQYDQSGLLYRMLTPNFDGVFSSCSVKADGAKEFAEKMARYHGIDFQSFNATAQWLEQRPLLAGVAVEKMKQKLADGQPNTEQCHQDAHFQYICSVDASRSPERAERLKEALHKVRCDAGCHDHMTLRLLSDWQAAVLGVQDVGLRRTDAYAKEGRERYPHSELVPEPGDDDDNDNNDDDDDCDGASDEGRATPFTEALRNASADGLAPEIRAARAYLDICFFHPFDDGNGRLARLVLDFVLTKAGLGLQDVGGLFGIPRRADDEIGAKAFVETLVQYTAPLGPNRDDDLNRWSTELRDISLLEDPPRMGYQVFHDFGPRRADLDRE